MFIITATGPRSLIESASNLLDDIGGSGAVSWWELERHQFKLEAIYPQLEDAQTGLDVAGGFAAGARGALCCPG
jgi:ribosomal protein L11 methyltransferase